MKNIDLTHFVTPSINFVTGSEAVNLSACVIIVCTSFDFNKDIKFCNIDNTVNTKISTCSFFNKSIKTNQNLIKKDVDLKVFDCKYSAQLIKDFFAFIGDDFAE